MQINVQSLLAIMLVTASVIGHTYARPFTIGTMVCFCVSACCTDHSAAHFPALLLTWTGLD
jgi:hypothetical protein